MPLTIVEALQRSEQGRTRPYVCRGDDGEVYFVKGRSATRRGLAAEWVAGCMARELGLPIAPFSIATVPEELVDADLDGWLADLGHGEVFASQRVCGVEFCEAHRHHVSNTLRRDVLAFDWWIRNGDRSLTPKGGNPNPLWNPTDEGTLVVIDHNLAFDLAFGIDDFVDVHVFSDEVRALFSDFVARQAYVGRFGAALASWDAVWR